MVKLPAIVVNVKTYAEATGAKAIDLAKEMEKVGEERGCSMVISVQATDLRIVSEQVNIPVFAEHIDPIKPGSHTGWTLPEAVRDAGAVGTLINHSEHRLKLAEIEEALNRAKECNLEVLLCTNNIPTSVAASALKPDILAIEPPELIGGDISVTTANPEVVRGAVNAVRRINKEVGILCGAGVKTGKDVSKAIALGSQGVLLASGVIKAKNKIEVFNDLASGLE
jgi:triosephosphate isomerase